MQRAEVGEGLVQVWVRAEGAACPGCGGWCTRVHDRYGRRLADAPVGGRRVVIRLGVRVLCCGNGGCPRRRFAEQPAGLAAWYARRTPLLAAQLAAVAAQAGGRPAARLARAVLAVRVSRQTLVRVLMGLPGPDPGLVRVRVLGVDDFSLRRGDRYATILVDMETGRPVDVLAGREQEVLEAWLEEHPGTEVICRDRASGYAAAARAAAPGAVQVADRWHLWHNLCGYVRDAVARHRDCLQGSCLDASPAAVSPLPASPPPGDLAGLEAVIRDRHEKVCALRAAGADLAQAAAAAGLSEQAAGRFWRAPDAEALLASARPAPGLDPWKPLPAAAVRRRRHQHHRPARRDHRARRHHQLHHLHGYASLIRLAAPPRPPAPPAPRQVTGWITTSPARLTPAGQDALTALTRRCPDLNTLASHVTAFAAILTQRLGDHLDDWLTTIEASPGQPELRSFAHGIRQDYQAVRNGLTLHWNSGRVEGTNTRIKLLKRQMYGRASFPLLRKRILLTS